MKVDVAIYIYGDRLRPELISKFLKIEPSESQAKGEPLSQESGHGAKIGLWKLSSRIQSNSVSEHLDEMIKKLGSLSTPLNKIQDVQGAYLDVFATDNETTARETVEFTLTKDQLEMLGRLGLSLRVTIM